MGDNAKCGATCSDSLEVACKCFPARWVLAMMSFCGMFQVLSLRINLSAAIVAMVDYEEVERQYNNHNDSGSGVGDGSGSGGSSNEVYGVCEEHGSPSANATIPVYRKGRQFVWDESMQGLVLASYYYGYICAQVAGAWTGRKLGRVRVWGYCILIAAICTLLLPASTYLGLPMLVAVRICIGFFSGVSYPIMQGMWGTWAPRNERGKLIAIQYAGGSVGAFVTLPLAAYLANEFGWESVFYTTGAIAAVWACAWLLLVYDSPATHPRISQKERDYIETSLGHAEGKGKAARKQPIPWISFLTSIVYWSAAIAHCANNFATQLFLTLGPTYLRTMLNFDVKSSGSLSSIPYICKVLLLPVAGWATDWMISKGVRTIYVRKASTFMTLIIPGAAMAAAGYVGCNAALALFLLAIPVTLDSFAVPGIKGNLIEIAPAFSGITYAVANTLSMSSGFTAPQIAGALREAHRDDPVQGWRLLFWLAAIIDFVGGTVFLIFATSEVQEWAQFGQEEIGEKGMSEDTLEKGLDADNEMISVEVEEKGAMDILREGEFSVFNFVEREEKDILSRNWATPEEEDTFL